MFRVLWPVEDITTGYQEAVRFAGQELPLLAEEADVKLIGEPVWEMVEHDDPERWPHTELVLVAVVPAVPAHPTREQWPDAIRYFAGQGLSDRDIGALFGVPRDGVLYVRRKHRIPAGKPPAQAVGEAA